MIYYQRISLLIISKTYYRKIRITKYSNKLIMKNDMSVKIKI